MRKQDEDRNGKPEALLWLDFETTGTDRNDSLPLEVGMECTDVLAARQEDNADWRAWRTMRGVDEMCVWYGALEHLGYQPSAEECEALKGAMVEKEQES